MKGKLNEGFLKELAYGVILNPKLVFSLVTALERPPIDLRDNYNTTLKDN